MGRIRVSTVILLAGAALLLALLAWLQAPLRQAHADETIHYVASDAATYYVLYEEFYAQLSLLESPALFLIGSPVLFMKLVDGQLWVIQSLNLVLMALTMKVAFDSLSTLRGRLAFLAGALVFPYFLFGFLSLNKEVYAVCAAILYGSYMIRGQKRHLLAALLVAACARYYLLLALVVLIFAVPRVGRPRYALVGILLLLLSLAAPIAKTLVPEYSTEGVLDDAGTVGVIFSRAIDSYIYFLIYPIKYLALMPMRAYGFLKGSDRLGDPMESVVSVASLLVFAAACLLWLRRDRLQPTVQRLIVAAFVAPVPIMWAEIMHWRYYSFVYFFFLYALVLHHVERERPASRPALAPRHA